MKKLPLIFLGALIAVQFAVPLSMIRSRENILHNGELFRFKTQPIDPADPFQGRYVRLGIDGEIKNQVDQSAPLTSRPIVYATIESDAEGFARFSGWSLKKPESKNYLKTRIGYVLDDGIQIKIPFDRYYMDEVKAPRAERLVWEATRGTHCWAEVRVLNGKAAIEEVFVEGQSLQNLAEKSSLKEIF